MKKTTSYFLFVGKEASYGQGAALTGSVNNIQLYGTSADDYPTWDPTYVENGDRGFNPETGAPLPGAPMSGRTVAGTIKVNLKGVSGSYGFPNADALLGACGLSGSNESGECVYVPVPQLSDFASVAMQSFDDVELISISGSVGQVKFGAAGPKQLVAEFAMEGVVNSDPVDYGATPARVFLATSSIAPSAKNCALTIGSFSPVVRSQEYTVEIEKQPRVDSNAVDGHSGFAARVVGVTAVITIELPAKSAFDPDADKRNATLKTISSTVGSAVGNRVGVNIAAAQLMDFKRTKENMIRLAELTYRATYTSGRWFYVKQF